jgi:hypothetical protein
MKNLLQKLEKSKFIDGVHKLALWADVIEFMDLLKNRPKTFEYSKSYKLEDVHFWDLRIKFNLMGSGFYQYLSHYLETQDDLMLSCNIDDDFILVAFKGKKNIENIIEYYFDRFKSIPVHNIEVDLDYNNKVHILMYDRKFKFPGIELN